ncbi:HNH endonuclease signature motif containing protein [Sorangium sp. So ce375]|uniref:HNH endonuclease n=1 Tax=Sorangium sp. So ce375 TaxID=3133306 RepID=UPI003F5B9019
MDAALVASVTRRAHAACEYCQLPQAVSSIPFEIDHIIAQKHGGPTVLENLGLACFYCNSHKGPNIAGIDPESGRIVRLYHPRKDRWNKHFHWDGPVLVGLSAVGRATLAVLVINHPDAVTLRASLIDEGLFPPTEPALRHPPRLP